MDLIMVIHWVPWNHRPHHHIQAFSSNHGTEEGEFSWTLQEYFSRSRSWNLYLPKVMQFDKRKPENMTFSSRSELFCGTRDVSDLGRSYSAYISEQLSQLLESG
ncbi:hypothetical protein MKX01_001202, partial [Papaver californicum]